MWEGWELEYRALGVDDAEEWCGENDLLWTSLRPGGDGLQQEKDIYTSILYPEK